MHRQLLVSLVFQLLAPLFGLIGPIFTESIMVSFSIENAPCKFLVWFIFYQDVVILDLSTK